MKRWYFTADVERASGWQSWVVKAETREEAEEKYAAGEYEFDDESIEVTALSKAVFSYSEEME